LACGRHSLKWPPAATNHPRKPKLDESARLYIVEQYAEVRRASSDQNVGKTLPITPRMLESIIRLATAYAKSRLSEVVAKTDAEVRLLRL